MKLHEVVHSEIGANSSRN